MQDDLRNDSFDRSANETEEQLLDLRIARALEEAPAVNVPQGFAARVIARLPEPTPQSEPAFRRTSFGFAAVVASMLVLLAAMIWLAPRANGHALYWTGFEWFLCAQFCALSAWFGLSRPQAD